MEPAEPREKARRLERLIEGLEQTRESLKFEIPYYRPDDVQGRYAKKFLDAVEGQIVEKRAELDALLKALPPEPRPRGE